MPCILKSRTSSSPGIISFTHNEALSEAFSNPKVESFLREQTRSGRWLFGVHIQGQFTWVKSWPKREWEKFFLWPDPDELESVGIEASRVIAMNCIQFMPEPPSSDKKEAVYDLCVITRPSAIKRSDAILRILRKVLDKKPDLKVVFVMPDPRKIELGSSCYAKQNIESAAYDLPLKLFSAKELKRFTFICTSTQSFGQFPLGNELIYDLLLKSKFSLSYSLNEGTPRAWIESLQVATPIMINEDVKVGKLDLIGNKNTVFLANEISSAAVQILTALKTPSHYQVDAKRINEAFGEIYHKPVLKDRLEQLIQAEGYAINGKWYLDDLNFRLPCHGERYNGQITHQPNQLFKWFETLENAKDPSDESQTFGIMNFSDSPAHPLINYGRRIVRKLKKTF